MQLKHFISIFIIALVTGNTLTAQQNWSLNQCISYAIENNVNLKGYEILEKLSKEDLNQSKRNLLPGINASSSAGLSYGRSIDPITNDYVTREFFNNSYNIRSSITVFSGFRLQNQIKYEKFRKQVSDYNRLNAIDDLAFQVMQSFFDVLYYEGMLEIAMEQVEASKLDLKATEKQVQVGLKARSDLLEMRANLEMEELNRILFENNKKTALLQLKQNMNLKSDEEMNLTEVKETMITENITDPQSLFSGYTAWSPYYKSFEANLKASQKNLAISRSNLYPFISAGGSISSAFSETNKSSLGNVIGFGDQLRNNKSQSIGASLSIPIFNRWSNRSNIKKAKLEVERAQNRLESEKQKIFFEMANDLNDLEALNKEYFQYQKQQEADKLAFQAAEKKFEQGLINVVEYYIAKNRLANTESQALRARTQWEIQMKTLEFYKGQRFWEK